MRALAVALFVCLAAAGPARADSLWCKTHDQDLWRQPYARLPAKPLDTIRVAADEVDPCLLAPIYDTVGLTDAAELERKRCAVNSALAIRFAAPHAPVSKPKR